MNIYASGDLKGILDTLVHMKEIERGERNCAT
jgi:hypothetical protein